MLARMERQRIMERHQLHLRKIKKRKPGYLKPPGSLMPADFDNAPPRQIQSRKKRQGSVVQEYQKKVRIERQNTTLLKRLFLNEARSSMYAQRKSLGPSSMNVCSRRANLLQILKDNTLLLRRIKENKSQYTVHKWETEHDEKIVKRKHMSNFKRYDEDVLRSSPVKVPRPPSSVRRGASNKSPRFKMLDRLVHAKSVHLSRSTKVGAGEEQKEIEEFIDEERRAEAHKSEQLVNEDATPTTPTNEKGLRHMFRTYDTHQTGALDAEALQQLMVDFASGDASLHPVNDELDIFIRAMDSDGNNLIDENELVTFFTKAYKLSAAKRAEFENRSGMHRKIMCLISKTEQMFQ